jgi:antirestriction protein ArdC
MSVYQIVTDKIIEELQKGVIPWRRPWTTRGRSFPINYVTRKPYTGVNQWLLPAGEYATYKQVQEAGGHVKKGEKGWLVVFFALLDSKEDEKKKIPILKYYTVFEINTQCEGAESKYKPNEITEHDAIEQAENIIHTYGNELAGGIVYGHDSAYYMPSKDMIHVPKLEDYKVKEEYYSVMFHEMVHSTGHETRLSRDGVTGKVAFGSETYSKEELVAELGSAMLCNHIGILDTTLQNSTSYLNAWIKKLKEDSRLIISASSQAQKATNYILGIHDSNENAND